MGFGLVWSGLVWSGFWVFLGGGWGIVSGNGIGIWRVPWGWFGRRFFYTHSITFNSYYTSPNARAFSLAFARMLLGGSVGGWVIVLY